MIFLAGAFNLQRQRFWRRWSDRLVLLIINSARRSKITKAVAQAIKDGSLNGKRLSGFVLGGDTKPIEPVLEPGLTLTAH